MLDTPKYEKYKASEIPDLGDIPAHWQVIRNRFLFNEQKARSSAGAETHLCMSQKLGLVPSDDFKDKTLQSESYEGGRLCNKGDLVLNRLKAHLSVFAIAPCDGLVSPDYSVFRIQDLEMVPEYFDHLFKTPVYLSEFNRRVKGIVAGFYRLYSGDFNDVKALCPPIEEQKRIVEFLDRKTAEIDEAIAQKQRLIELLQEQKAIFINQAVVKGLNPDAEMRDSGIDWIGEIPDGWKSQRLKFSVRKIYDCKNRTPEYFESGKYFVIRTSNVRDGQLKLKEGLYTDKSNFVEWTQKGQPMPGELVFTREAPAGEVAMVPGGTEMCLGQRMMGIKHKDSEVLSSYLLYFLQSQSLKEYVAVNSAGSTVTHLRVGQVFDIPLIYPSQIAEQKEIVSRCATHTEETENACHLIEDDIQKIQELRQTLVANAVTGKIKI